MSLAAPEDTRASPRPRISPQAWKAAGVCAVLIAGVWLIYGQTVRFPFVNLDDDVYVYQNARISAGLTRAGAAWFFTHAYCDFWAPLLALSQMADCQLYGLWPGGHHLTNVILFTATAPLLFLVLRRLTGALWPSAFVAAAWTFHPLRAESVAWVTERKDMLSGFFFLLTLAAYLHYVRRPRSWPRYLAVPLLFALAGMCKPTVVTLPFVLLLLDYWPLGRIGMERFADWRAVIVEKIPLFLISAALSMVTVLSGTQTLMAIERAPPLERVCNALISCATYLRQTFYPAGLSAFVPYPIHPAPVWETALAFTVLALLTAAALGWRRTHPWLLVGWFWYLGMLIPMLGFLQAGEQAHADRFTYLPQIGLLMAIVWTAWHWLGVPSPGRRLAVAASGVGLVALLVCARIQASYWRDPVTLWTRVLACTSDNNFAQNNMGVALLGAGRPEEAGAHFEAAIALEPRNMITQFNLANALMQKGRADEAIARYRTALALRPVFFDALNNLGIALASVGRNTEAAEAYRRALALEPESAMVHDNFGRALLGAGRVTEAIGQFERAIEIDPAHEHAYEGLGAALVVANRPAEAERCYRKAMDLEPGDEAARAGFANALLLQGRAAEAVENWRKALELKPVKPATLNNLAWALATGPAEVRNGTQAVQMADLAVKLGGASNPNLTRTLAAAYAEAGRFPEARQMAATALDLANARSDDLLSAKIEGDLLQYNASRALRESPARAAGR